LKLKVQVSDSQYIDHLINLVDTYILTRNEKIEAGKIDDQPIHNIRGTEVMGSQIIFNFDFGMASPKTLKGIFDVFEKSGHVVSVVLFSYG
jgi:hypothetical protein